MSRGRVLSVMNVLAFVAGNQSSALTADFLKI
jgi:hypothetical protein